MSRDAIDRVPLAALAARDPEEQLPDLPIAYIPRLPDGRTYREVVERAVGWGRR
jgi:hypothetical protein